MNHRTSAVLAATLAAASHAHAGRPLATEDAGVLAQNECEWESFAARVRAPGALAHAWVTQLACGVMPELQVALSYGQTRGHGHADESASINGKWGLLRGYGDEASLVLAGGSVGGKTSGTGFRLGGLFLNGVLTKPLAENWTGHLNLGWTQDRTSRPHALAMTWNLAAEVAAGNGLEWMAEVYGAERSDAFVGAGLRWAAGKAWSLNAGYAVQLAGARTKLLTVGAKLTF